MLSGAVAAMLVVFPRCAQWLRRHITVSLETLTDQKAVFATVESPNVVPARARIGGTIVSLAVRQGDTVTQGQVIAVVGDDKLLLQINSLDAQIAGLQSQLAQAQTDLTRAETLVRQGVGPRTTLDAGAHRGGCRQRGAARPHRRARGGAAAAAGGPGAGAGRRPRGDGAADQGTVVLNGDTIATIGDSRSCCGCGCRNGTRCSSRPATRSASIRRSLARAKVTTGTIELVYPQIEDGRVIADAQVDELGEYFVGDRLRVWIAGGTRPAFVIPASFVTTRFGIDYVRLRQRGRQRRSIRRCSAAATSRRPRLPADGDSDNPLRHAAPATMLVQAMNLGLSGRLTRATIGSPLTPLFLLAALVVGLIALLTIPREEEPQISVPMVDIMVQRRRPEAPDAVELVTKPLEAIVKGIDGVEHVYSQTEDDR